MVALCALGSLYLITPSRAADLNEPNDSFVFATSLSIPSTTQGEIENATDQDYFSVFLNTGGNLTVTLYNISADLDLTFYDDMQNPILYSQKGGTENETIEFPSAPYPGINYIHVLGYAGATSTYTLDVGNLMFDDPYEPNNNATQASALIQYTPENYGTEYPNPTLSGADLADYFKFDLDRFVGVSVSVYTLNVLGLPMSNFNLTIFDLDNTTILSQEIFPYVENSRLYTLSLPRIENNGTFVLSIRSNDLTDSFVEFMVQVQIFTDKGEPNNLPNNAVVLRPEMNDTDIRAEEYDFLLFDKDYCSISLDEGLGMVVRVQFSYMDIIQNIYVDSVQINLTVYTPTLQVAGTDKITRGEIEQIMMDNNYNMNIVFNLTVPVMASPRTTLGEPDKYTLLIDGDFAIKYDISCRMFMDDYENNDQKATAASLVPAAYSINLWSLVQQGGMYPMLNNKLANSPKGNQFLT